MEGQFILSYIMQFFLHYLQVLLDLFNSYWFTKAFLYTLILAFIITVVKKAFFKPE